MAQQLTQPAIPARHINTWLLVPTLFLIAASVNMHCRRQLLRAEIEHCHSHGSGLCSWLLVLAWSSQPCLLQASGEVRFSLSLSLSLFCLSHNKSVSIILKYFLLRKSHLIFFLLNNVYIYVFIPLGKLNGLRAIKIKKKKILVYKPHKNITFKHTNVA